MLRLLVLVVLCASAPRMASAQTPNQGRLFGGDAQSGARRPMFDMTVSLSSAFDDDLGAGQGSGVSMGEPSISGHYSVVDASLSFLKTSPRFSLGAGVTSSARHYPDLDSVVGSNYALATNMTVAVTRKTFFRTAVDANHVSSLVFDAFSRRTAFDRAALAALAEGSPAINLDASSLDWTTTSYGGSADVQRAVGKRSSLSVTASIRDTRRPMTEERLDDRTFGAQFIHNVGRDTVVRFGHTFHHGTRRLGSLDIPAWSHDAQVFVERQWRHSALRRTAINFSGGPSLLQQHTTTGIVLEPPVSEAGPSPTPGTERARLMQVVGTLALVHDISRTWHTLVSYRRGAGIRDVAVFSNTAALDVRGAMGRRVGLFLSAGYTDGDIGLDTPDNRYETSFGSARLQLALTKFVALFGQYSAYRYNFGSAFIQALGQPGQLNRRGVQVGVMAWMPL